MILLINQLTIPIFADVANALSATGEDVILFTGKIDESHTPLRHEIKVVHSFAYKRKSLFTRFLSWFLFSAHLVLFLLTKRKIRHILVVTNPPLAPIVVSVLARLRKINYSVLIYDLYPEALSQAGLSSERSWIYRRWQKINPTIFDHAKRIVTLSESMRSAISVHIRNKDLIQVIPNWVETSYIKPIPKSENPFVMRQGLSGKFVVMYSGNMGLTHDLESLLDAAFLLKSNSKFVFVLIGEGAKLATLLARKERENLDNVIFLPYQSAHDFPLAMAAAEVGVVTLGVGAEGISVPSKTYVNMAAGLCLLTIAPKGSELNRLVEMYDCGFICEPKHPELIVSFLNEIAQAPEKLARYQANARNASLHFGSENANRYVDVVKA